MLTSVYSDRIRGKVVLTLAAMVTACVAFAPWTGRTELASLPVWRSLTRFDGLASENVRDIASDIDGGLWFATSAGLSRFDGLWTTFTRVEGLPSNDIRALAPVGDNDLWIATAAGVSHLRRSSPGAWDIELADTALPGVEVFDVVVARNADRPSVWAGTRDGLHAFTDGRWTQFAPTAATPVRVLASDVNGFLWCARDRRGEEPYAVLRVPAVGAPPDTFPLPDSLGAAAVRAIFSPDPGTLWVGTSAGLLELDGDWSEPLFPPGVVDVTGFTRHPDGSLWIATSRGVFRHGTEWTQFGTEHGFPVPPIRAIHVEPTTGSVWVSTPAGVAHARGPWSRLSALTGLPTDSVRHVVADLSGNVWAATPVGLLQLSADAIALYGVETGLPSARIRAVAVAPDGRVWAGSDGTRGGLAIPEGETFRTLRAANGIGESNEVYSIAFDSRGRAWVGTGILRDPPDDVDILGGVARFDGATWRYWRTGSTPVAIAEDVRGTVWIGTKRRGLLRLDGDEFIEEPLPVGSEVRAILADGRGWLWVGTSDGLFARVGGEWREYSRADGLPGNSVRALIEDSTDGTVWAALDEGIAHWDPIRQWSQFTAADGVPSTGVLSVAQSVNGDLWFSGIGDSGLLRHRASTSLPQTRLLEAPRGIIGETATRISFTGGDVTTPPDQIRYAIRLDGGAWSAPQAEPSVFLSGLAPGRPILFEVAAVNRDGMADPTPARTVFYADVSPPYAEIAFPSGGSHVAGVVQLRGRAYDETDFEGYMVRIPGANPVQSDRAVRDGVLAEWDTRNVEDGEYELSLAVWDRLDGPNDVRHERSRVLSLVVDNTIPVVTLEPMVSPVSGRVLVRAELVDANLSSYRVEYRTSADGAWRNIEAGDLPLGAGGRASIAASWDTTPLDASVEVRVVAHDLAGNAGQASQGLAASNPGARPIVQVSAPASDSVLSGVVRVVGTASDETLVGFVVEARRSASEPWAGVGFGSAAVTGGVLSEWDTTRVADGTYELRVRAIDDAGYETIAPVPPLVIRIDNTPPILVSFPLPSPAQLYSGRGTIPIEAVIRDDSPITFRFEYSTSLTPSASDWLPAASGSATSDGRASTFWTVPTLDGDVLLRLLATDAAGHEMAPQVRQVSLDAALPRAQIISPEGGGIVTGVVTVVGTASDSHFAEYRLLYATPDGVDHPISARTSGDGVTQGVLGQWNTEGSEGPVSLRLRVRDAVGLESEAVVALAVDRSRPTASLRSPVSGSQVSGIVTMAGTATDRHFASYRIDWRLADGETWNPVTDSVSTAVIDGRLASWDTTGITGKAIVRLTATDVVGQSATSIAAVDVVAPVAADAGARLVSADGVVALRVPPKSLSSSIAITINPAPVASGNALMVYTLSPVDASLDSRKPAMLEFHLPPDAPLDSAIARWNAVTQEWQWLGGTVSGGAVRASISSFGTYAVLNGGRTPPISGDDALRLRSQPRAFSPSGGNLPGSTVVSFRLAKESPTRIRIYHGNGRLVRRLLDSDLRPGEHAIDWDGKDDDGDVVPNGIYVVYVGTRFAEATRLVLVWAP